MEDIKDRSLLKDFSLLIVEDDTEAALSLQLVLSKYLKRVDIAFDGKEGLERFSAFRYDIVLTDISMPRMDGLQMSEALKQIDKSVQIVIMTAFTDVNLCSCAMRVGANGYIQKPTLMEQVYEALHRSAIAKVDSTMLSENTNLLTQYKNAIDITAIVSKTDLNGVITYVNDMFCEASGYTKKELVGKPHNVIRHPDTPKEVFVEMWDTIKSGKVWSGIIKNRAKDNSFYIVNSTVIPIFDTAGSINEYMSIRNDITMLTQALEEAKAGKRAKEEFLANMSHEIRTPLNAILGFVELLKDTNMDSEQKKYVDIVHKSGEMLLSVINGILDFAKLEKGKLEVELIEFDPYVEFRHVVELFSASAKNRGVSLKSELAEELPKRIKSDIFRLKQIVSNLISNAIKFTPTNKSVTLRVGYDKEQNRLLVSVVDEGCGISKENLTKIFEPFEQSSVSIGRTHGGTGLGLAICHGLVELLGGKLGLKSELDVGSEFFFDVPVEVVVGSIDGQLSLPTRAAVLSNFEGNIILVAEDNEANQLYIKILLGKMSIKTVMVGDGEAAVEMFMRGKYDLVLLDEHMPKLNGSEAAERMLTHERENALAHTPIIALTAGGYGIDEEKFVNLDGYLSKPIDTKLLLEELSRHLKPKPIKKPQEQSEIKYNDVAVSLGIEEADARELVSIFRSSVMESLNISRKAIKNNDFDNMILVMHKVSGSIGKAVGIGEINDIAKIVEKNGINRVLDFDYDSALDRIEELLGRLPKE